MARIFGVGPDMVITLTMYSTPVELGTATSDATGEATITFVAPETTGTHTLVADSDCPDATLTVDAFDPWGGVFDPDGPPAQTRTTTMLNSSSASAAAPTASVVSSTAAVSAAAAPIATGVAAAAPTPVATKPAFTGGGRVGLAFGGVAALGLGALLLAVGMGRNRRRA